MNASARRVDPEQKHRRVVRYRIVAPVILAALALAGFAIVLIVATASGSLESKQISVIMGVLLTVFILIPVSLLCLIPYVLLVFSVVGVGQLYSKGAQPLRAVRRLSTRITQQTDSLAPRIAAPFAAFNVRAARWEQMLRSLGRQPEPPDSPRDHP